MGVEAARGPGTHAVPTVADIEIRADLRDAQRLFVESLGDPGTWWTGSERVAVADGQPLPSWAVDAAWRITNHPGTTTHDWYRSLLDRADDDDRAGDNGADRNGARSYVDLVSVVAVTDARGASRLSPSEITRV